MGQSDLDVKALGPLFKMLSPSAQKGMTEAVQMQSERVSLEASLKKHRSTMGLTQLRIHQDRIATIDSELRKWGKVTEIIRRGFDPYTPPKNWFGGHVDREKASPGELVFSAPIPDRIQARYQAAKRTGLFDLFMVFSPKREHFTQVAPLRIDPVLVGYLGQECFLIGYWDLSGDRDYYKTTNS